MTLNDLLKAHPEWADLPIAVYRNDGGLDYLGGAGSAYQSEDWEDLNAEAIEGTGSPVLVFSAN